MGGIVAEIPVSGHQRNVMIETGLRYQRIGQAHFKPAAKKLSPELAGSFPIAIANLKAGNGAKQQRQLDANCRITQQFSHHDRREYSLAEPQGCLNRCYVRSMVAGEKCDHRTAIESDHYRSSRNSFKLIENFILPRIFSSCSYASLAARSSRPLRTVSLMPACVALCALASSSRLTWTVIFCSALMPNNIPAFYAVIDYGIIMTRDGKLGSWKPIGSSLCGNPDYW